MKDREPAKTQRRKHEGANVRDERPRRSNATTTARRGVVKKEISYREGSEREHGRSKCLVNLTGGQTTEVYDYSIFW